MRETDSPWDDYGYDVDDLDADDNGWRDDDYSHAGWGDGEH